MIKQHNNEQEYPSFAPATPVEPQGIGPIGIPDDLPSESQRPSTDEVRKARASTNPGFLTAEEWLVLPEDNTPPVIGEPGNCIVGPLTKNIIQGGEKTFKTTFALRLLLALSCGKTVFPALPVPTARKALYVHGELSPPEMKKRLRAASVGLSGSLSNFRQGRDLRIHLARRAGQEALAELIAKFKPQDVVLDPWQSFISGCDENDFKDVSAATSFLDALIEDYGITLWICVHEGKDSSKGMRGHSSLGGWRDALIRVQRAAKSREFVTVTIDPRWAEPLKPFTLRFDKGTVWPTDKPQPKGRILEIRSYLENHGGRASKQEVIEALKFGSKDALRKTLERSPEAGVRSEGDEVILAPEFETEEEAA